MRILISGSSGLLGTALVDFLKLSGHQVYSLVRRPVKNQNEISWNPQTGALDLHAVENFDAFINLAGENIFARRWNKQFKQMLVDSRLQTTRLMADVIAKLKFPPKVFLCPSGVNIYQENLDEMLTENGRHGAGFLAKLCEDWEAAANAADQKTRVVNLRIGMVITPKGGGVGKMLLPFKLGLGGVIGSGNQWISWIDMEDFLRIVEFSLLKEELQGPVNVVSPFPVSNREFTKSLGKVLRRPTIMAMPSVLARMVFGEAADEVLISGVKIHPEKLLSLGYKFRYPKILDSLYHFLGDVN